MHNHHLNMWYCYTPVKTFYDLYDTFLHRQDIMTGRPFVCGYMDLDGRSIISE